MLNALMVIKQCPLSLLIKNLKNYTKKCEKVSSLMNIKSDSEPAYGDNDKSMKTEIKVYGDNVNTNFHGKKYQKKILHVNFCH